MRAKHLLLAMALAASLAACGTGYQSRFLGIFAGFSDKELEPGIWRVEYNGNGYTNWESAQTYWLYRCAELAKEKGFDGFEVLTTIRQLSQDHPIRLAANTYSPVYIMTDYGNRANATSYFSGDIRGLKMPFTPVPQKIFDANVLKAALEPYVKGPGCDGGNVCPHVHRYLHPEIDNPPSR